ncbi:HAMP domain-containing histidine kinase, partial [candidate division KSB1 bacterium]|nr:HAMP domain-containing histidine kinase [candidate division KSB1 bacterium]
SPVIRRVFLGYLFSGFFVILVSSFVGWRLVAYLNKRLERLKSGVSKVSQGEFVRIEVVGKDEIAFLARSFNLMSQRIKKLVENLEESNAARQRLLAHASHEIKSPLTSVKGFIDIIEFMNVLSEDQQKGLLPIVKKDINRVIKLTNDMLQLAQFHSTRQKFDMKSIHAQEFLEEEHNHFAHKAVANNATATIEFNLEKTTALTTDPERLSQILDNLWNNALKYGDLSHPIHTSLYTQNNVIHIKISNHLVTKLDVPPDRLFEPFYRSPSTADNAAGSGLGLAIVRELTDKLNGKIQTRLTDEMIEIDLLFKKDMQDDDLIV